MSKFEVGDRVAVLSVSETYGNAGLSGKVTLVPVKDNPKGDICNVLLDNGTNTLLWDYKLELYNKGETTMTNEEQLASTPDYIIITRNTDMFKKGGVFKYYTSFWAPETSVVDTYIVKPYDTNYISPEHGKILLEKKIAVPALQFNPEFVTLEQNEVLQKALAGMSKSTKKTVKKSK